MHVQTEQITLCVSRFLQTHDSDQSATQITSADVQVNNYTSWDWNLIEMHV